MFHLICMTIIALPMLLFFPVKKIGKKNMKELKGKNYIISCNHMSNLDAVMMDIVFFKKFRYLSKKELYENKVAGFFMRRFGGIPVDRKNPDPSSIKEVFSVIKKGKKVCIFPQGTRKPTPRIDGDTAKEGVAMFSIRTGTPVVPMVYSRKFKMFKRTKLLIGKPLYPDIERKKDKAYVSEFADLIVAKMNELLDGE